MRESVGPATGGFVCNCLGPEAWTTVASGPDSDKYEAKDRGREPHEYMEGQDLEAEGDNSKR